MLCFCVSQLISCYFVVAGGVRTCCKSLRQAIEKTQRNVEFKVDEDTPYGQYMYMWSRVGIDRSRESIER